MMFYSYNLEIKIGTLHTSTDKEVPGWLQSSTNTTKEIEMQKPQSTVAVDAGTSTAGTPTMATTANEATWCEHAIDAFQRDGRLLLVTIGILVCMNVPYVRWVFYPFDIFSTWIHEMCHGLAAILVGERIAKLNIFSDTSGLAYTSGAKSQAFVSSAGYQGTAVIGCLLLLFRRTKRGPRTGTTILAWFMILSTVLWIRNVFGFIFILSFGVVLQIAAWKLPSSYIRVVYLVLAVTTTLNAVTNVQNLFGSSFSVNGTDSSTDAHTMVDLLGGWTHYTWAIMWLALAVVLMLLGVLFAVPGPDEAADFACCGLCQDYGIFNICNAPGQRHMQRAVSRIRGTNDEAAAPSNVAVTTAVRAGSV